MSESVQAETPESRQRPAGIVGEEDYRIAFEPSAKRVKVIFNGVKVADSRRAVILHETRYAPIYYLPVEDVRMDLLERSEHRTYCPFKGNASYWSIAVGDQRAENAVWGYEDPYEEVAPLKGYVAFYWNKVDAWSEEEPEVAMETGGDVERNRFAGWLLREAWHADTTEELFARFARALVEHGIPLWRLNLILRTLHPQLVGHAYVWRRDWKAIETRRIAYSSLQTSAYLDNPLAPIFEGAGGIRRRLEGDNPQLDFPVLEEFREQGATDYVAMPMLFSDGQINALTLTSDRKGGFSTDDLGQIYELLPVISRLFEVQAMRLTAKTLLDTYLGMHSGERVLRGRIKRGDGESIPAVIWLCDLRGSTAMTETLPREAYLALLNDFFDASAGAVLEQDGEVLKFIGDAVLAIFPMQEADGVAEPACRKALAAARAMAERMAELNRARSEAGGPPLRYALALHKGEVTYGNVGAPSRLDFTVIGPAMNETARLGNLAKALDRSVLLSDVFAQHLPEDAVSLGRHGLRGVSEQHEVFTLTEGA